jgi:uncharacterized membrane protein YbhN (UPF0104 family)
MTEKAKAETVHQRESAGTPIDGGEVNQRGLKLVLPTVFSVLVLCGFAVYLYLNADRFGELLDLSLAALLSLCSLVLAAIFLKGVINTLLYRELGTTVGLNEGIGLAIMNTVSNHLPLSGGLIAKALYLKRRHQLAYTSYVSATVALYICFVSSNGLLGLAGLGYQLLTGDRAPLLLALGFLGMTASILVFSISVNTDILPEGWRKRVTRLVAGWQVLKGSPSLVARTVGLQTLLTVLAAGRLWIAFHALSQNVTLNHCILFSSVSILTRLVSISPGGLGVREAVIASVASVLGFDLGVSAVAVGLERLISTPINIGLGVIYSYALGKGLVETQRRAEGQ